MDTYIRNLDAATYRTARARAALEGRAVGEVITEALREYLARTAGAENSDSLLEESTAAVDETLSATRVDEVVFLYCI